MKKFLFCFIPTSLTHSPEMSIPSITAQLRYHKYNVSAMDLNIDFFHHIFTKEYLTSAVKEAESQYEDLKKKKDLFLNKEDTYENIILNQKYNELDIFFQHYTELAQKVPYSVEKALQILKNEQLFYNPKLLSYACQVINYAKKISCLPYAPFDFYFTYETYFEDLCKIVFDKNRNIFWNYFEKKVQEIKDMNFDYVGISISYRQQLIAGLTLAYLLKKHTNAHINIGGNYFSRLTDYIPNYIDLFEKFIDSISYGESENSIIELAKYIEGEIDISEVPQLIYKDKETGEIKQNPLGKPVILTKIQPPDYSDFDFDKYLLPERVLPVQVQRGCYWNKCAFCESAFEKSPSVKTVEQLISEMKLYNEKYKVSTFMIIDETITPEYLEKFSDEIIKRNLNYKFMMSLRLEKKVTHELLTKMYKAGFRSFWLGLETSCERLLELINKGVTSQEALQVLKDSNSVGILNNVYCLVDFPTATYEEDLLTFEFIKNSPDIVHNILYTEFMLTKNSRIYNNPDKYGIEIIEDSKNSRISLELNFRRKIGMSQQEHNDIVSKFFNHYWNDKFQHIIAPYYLTLYCNKLGLDFIKKNILK